MRIGQISVIVFLSRFVGAALGFLATIYFARVLGAEVIGLYALVISLMVWLRLAGKLGFGGAMIKRISEGEDQGSYLIAGAVSIAAIGAIITIGVITGKPLIEAYVDEFSTYVGISVIWFVLLLLYAELFKGLSNSALRGKKLVHIAGILSTVSIGVRSIVQIILVLAGFSLAGMLVGHAVGVFVIGVIGFVYVSIQIELPTRDHFRDLFDYAKYSWFGGLESRSFNDADIIVLGLFVPSALVGVYAIAWSIARFLKLFGGAISETLFPEISHRDAEQRKEEVRNLIEDGLAYAGLISIPGVVGGTIIGDRILLIYGSEFVQGTAVLSLLIVATLVYSYQQQCINAINAIDRPDLAFRINLVFTVTNILLNLLLVWQYGWIGAAIATVLSTIFGTLLSYITLSRQISISAPYGALGKQTTAALLMGGIVWVVRETIETTGAISHNVTIVLLLVAIGAGTYFVLLLGLSSRFRSTVDRNIPFDRSLFG